MTRIELNSSRICFWVFLAQFVDLSLREDPLLDQERLHLLLHTLHIVTHWRGHNYDDDDVIKANKVCSA